MDELAGVDETAKQIYTAIAELFFSAENQDRFIGTAEQLGLSPPMLRGLAELEPGESRPMRTLAEAWGCDASFVTVIVDGLEQGGYVDRRVAEHDRRVKTVELTEKGVEARDWALGEVYGPRRGLSALTLDEQVTLAGLLGKLAAAQAEHDRELVGSGRVRTLKHMAHAHKGFRSGRIPGPDSGDGGEPWRDHLAAHREELHRLRDELTRFRDEVRAQVHGTAPEAPEASGAAGAAGAAGAEVKAQLKGRARPPG